MSSAADTKQSVDVSNACRGVWLVKVPKYVSSRWNSSDEIEVGKLRITRKPGCKPDITFSLDEVLAKKKLPPSVTGAKAPTGINCDTEVPSEHKFVVGGIVNQTLAVFSQQSDNKSVVSIEGRITQRAECKPIANDKRYMELKKQTILMASQPLRIAKQLDKVVNAYKPVSDHKNNIEYEHFKKNEGKKMRGDKDKVTEMLFAAFEKHQYYNLKDLVRVTKQPVGYLKEILKELCNYNMKMPHKNMWELKPEFRHYNKPEEEGDEPMQADD